MIPANHDKVSNLVVVGLVQKLLESSELSKRCMKREVTIHSRKAPNYRRAIQNTVGRGMNHAGRKKILQDYLEPLQESLCLSREGSTMPQEGRLILQEGIKFHKERYELGRTEENSKGQIKISAGKPLSLVE